MTSKQNFSNNNNSNNVHLQLKSKQNVLSVVRNKNMLKKLRLNS